MGPKKSGKKDTGQKQKVTTRLRNQLYSIFYLIFVLFKIAWGAIALKSCLSLTSSFKTTQPTMVVFFSGLAGPEFTWNHFSASVVRCLKPNVVSLRCVSNVEALWKPMHQNLNDRWIPVLKNHCDRWGTRSRLAFVGHSLGAVDSIAAACAIRKHTKGSVPVYVSSICGAYGVPFIRYVPFLVHGSVKSALADRAGPFFQSLFESFVFLPDHNHSTYRFYAASEDLTVPNAFPPVKKIHAQKRYVVRGVGHLGAMVFLQRIVGKNLRQFFFSLK